MQTDYKLTHDPLFYGMVAVFALLTTALPAVLGQPRFLPLAQTAGLSAFLAIAVRSGQVRHRVLVVSIWLALQMALLLTLTWLLADTVEAAFVEGFRQRAAFLEWFYAGSLRPGGIIEEPAARFIEWIGLIAGSLLTGGVIGVWFLVQAANLAAFHAGSLLVALGNPLAALPPWTLLRLAGSAGLVILLAEPLLTGNWSPRFYLRERRHLLWGALALLLLGLVLELILPPAWRTLFGGS